MCSRMLLVACGIAALPLTAAAQPPDQPIAITTTDELNEAARVAFRRAIKKVFAEGAVQEPLATTGGQSAASRQVTIVADKGDVNARGRFSFPVNETSDLQITATAPLTAGKATFVDATGLTGNASINASVKVVFFSKSTTAMSAPSLAGFRSFSAAADERQALGSLEALRRQAALSEPTRTAARMQSMSAGSNNVTNARLAAILASPSVVSSSNRFWETIVKDPQLVSTTWVGYVTPGYEASRSSIDYLTADTFKKDTFTRTSNLFTFSGGVSRTSTWQKPGTTGEDDQFKLPLFYAGVAFKGGQSVKAEDPRNICTPTTTGSATECFNLPVGIPVPSTSTSFTIEFRQWANDQSLGINPKITWTSTAKTDTTPVKDSRVFEVPIYLMHLVKDATNPSFTFGADLTGGIDIGYRTSTSNPSTNGPFVTVFFTKIFDTP